MGEGVIDHRHGELYPVTAGSRTQARLLIDRACAPYFGVRAFGQHLNGFVRDADGLKLWIGRRALDRRVYPGYLDNLVAGGLPWGIGLAENLRKECHEEAGMDAETADRARPRRSRHLLPRLASRAQAGCHLLLRPGTARGL